MAEQTLLIDLAREECEDLLAAAPLGRLAVLVDGHPEIYPVNHVYDRGVGAVVFPTHDGTKLHAALTWPFVAYEVDGPDDGGEAGWSVLVVGVAEEVTDADAIERIAAGRAARWMAGARTRWIRIVPEKITGRRIRLLAH